MSTNESTTPEAQVTTAPESAPAVNTMDAHEIPFIETLPQAVREMPHMAGVADVEGFINRISDLGKVPQAPEKYEFQIPEGLQTQAELMEAFSTVAKDASLSQEQADKVVGMWHELQMKALSEQTSKMESAAKTLQSEWGKDYDSNLSLAKKAVDHFGGKELAAYLDQSGMGNHLPLIKAFQAIGKALGEDSIVGLESKDKPAQVDRWNGLPLLNFNM